MFATVGDEVGRLTKALSAHHAFMRFFSWKKETDEISHKFNNFGPLLVPGGVLPIFTSYVGSTVFGEDTVEVDILVEDT